MPALTACRRTVSGTLSLPSKGCFSPFPHGTCTLSVSGEYLALADGPAGFTRGSTCPALLRIPTGSARLRVRGSHPLRRAVPGASPRRASFLLPVLQPPHGRNRAGLGSSPVARHYWGNHVLFSLPPGTKMFQFPGFASRHQAGWQSVRLPGCPIRTSGGHRSPAPNPGFSQLAASFVAFQSQGIRRAPFPTFTAGEASASPAAAAGTSRARTAHSMFPFLCSSMSMNGGTKRSLGGE